jgi:hypothetical protein
MERQQWSGQPKDNAICEFCGGPVKDPPWRTQEWRPPVQSPPAHNQFNESSRFIPLDGHLDLKAPRPPDSTSFEGSLLIGGGGTSGMPYQFSSGQPPESWKSSARGGSAPPFFGSPGFNDPDSPFHRNPSNVPRPGVEYTTPTSPGMSPLYQQNQHQNRLEEQQQRQEDYEAPRCSNCGRRPSRYYAK